MQIPCSSLISYHQFCNDCIKLSFHTGHNITCYFRFLSKFIILSGKILEKLEGKKIFTKSLINKYILIIKLYNYFVEVIILFDKIYYNLFYPTSDLRLN